MVLPHFVYFQGPPSSRLAPASRHLSSLSTITLGLQCTLKQWSSQVIGIGWAPAVRLTIALTTLVLAHT